MIEVTTIELENCRNLRALSLANEMLLCFSQRMMYKYSEINS